MFDQPATLARMKRILIAAVLLLAAGCGGSSKPASTRSAEQIADALKTKVSTAQTVTVLTQANDANKLLGRPHQYTSAAVITDSAGDCSDGPGVDCGATIEVFGSDADAKARATYLDRVVSSLGSLATEYDYRDGVVLLRVAGALSPDQAKAYDTALKGR